MSSLNKVFLMGHLTRDPESKTTSGGTTIWKCGMAINRKWTKDGATQESVCYVDLTAFGRTADTLTTFMKKGRPLFVEGRLEYSTWESEGKKRSKLEVVIDTFQFIGAKEPEPATKGGDDIPF